MEQAKPDDICNFDEILEKRHIEYLTLLISLHLLSASHPSEGGRLAVPWPGAAFGLLPMDNLCSFFQHVWLNS